MRAGGMDLCGMMTIPRRSVGDILEAKAAAALPVRDDNIHRARQALGQRRPQGADLEPERLLAAGGDHADDPVFRPAGGEVVAEDDLRGEPAPLDLRDGGLAPPRLA